MQCCTDHARTTLHRNIVQSVLFKYVWDNVTPKNYVQCWPRAHKHGFRRKISYTMLSWSAWANISQENYLWNIGPQYTSNFAHKKNLQFCLDLSGPTLHKEINCAMLAQSAQIYFRRKTDFFKYVCRPVF